MTQFAKPALNPNEHIKLFKDRKLTIDDADEIEIKTHIRRIGYHRLSRYFGSLQSEPDIFSSGVNFWDILNLYRFDQDLRMITIDALSYIEVELRARMTDIYGLRYDCFWYLNQEYFVDDTQKIEVNDPYLEEGKIIEGFKQVDFPMYKILLNEILKAIEDIEQSEFMKNFRKIYSPDSPVPSWMVFENISFGKLSRLYYLLKRTPEKTAIAQHFGAVSSDILISWLHSLVVLRNICAHHSRLWNRNIGKDLRIPQRHNHRFLTIYNQEGLRKYFGISSCLLKMLNEIDKKQMGKFKKLFFKIVEQHKIDISEMGFPADFQKNEIWK